LDAPPPLDPFAVLGVVVVLGVPAPPTELSVGATAEVVPASAVAPVGEGPEVAPGAGEGNELPPLRP
jgi:hypothetical protein